MEVYVLSPYIRLFEGVLFEESDEPRPAVGYFQEFHVLADSVQVALEMVKAELSDGEIVGSVDFYVYDRADMDAETRALVERLVNAEILYRTGRVHYWPPEQDVT